MTILGILGGGYLARLTTQAAQKLGVNVAVLDKDEHSPAAQVTAYAIDGDWDDFELVGEFAATCDAVTVESDAVPVHVLAHLESQGRVVRPGSAVVAAVRDRMALKQMLNAAGIETVAYAPVASIEDLAAFYQAHTYGVVLKTCVGGKDSRGNAAIRKIEDIQPAFDRLSALGKPLMVEVYQHTERELAICGARGQDGAVRLYPVASMQIQHGVVHTVNAPVEDKFGAYLADHGRAADAVYFDGVPALAKRIAELLGVIGAFSIELLEAGNGRVLVSSVRLGPTTAGLYTVDACAVSIFENHVRAVLGQPLGWTDMTTRCAAAVTLLGRNDELPGAADFTSALAMRGAHVHWYGKASAYRLRKLGHITGLHETDPEAERIASMTAVALLGW